MEREILWDMSLESQREILGVRGLEREREREIMG